MPLALSPASPKNYGSRGGARIDRLVIHVTEGTASSALNWFADDRAHASAHYLVDRSGRVWDVVPESHAAWHAGNSDVNHRSIGIELEGRCSTLDVPEPQFAALVELAADVCRRRRIAPVRPTGILGHCDVPDPAHPGQFGGKHHHSDPGDFFPWPRFLAAVSSRLEEPA